MVDAVDLYPIERRTCWDLWPLGRVLQSLNRLKLRRRQIDATRGENQIHQVLIRPLFSPECLP